MPVVDVKRSAFVPGRLSRPHDAQPDGPQIGAPWALAYSQTSWAQHHVALLRNCIPLEHLFAFDLTSRLHSF
jgi:hypothetical protein